MRNLDCVKNKNKISTKQVKKKIIFCYYNFQNIQTFNNPKEKIL